jgi:hypothetical protein
VTLECSRRKELTSPLHSVFWVRPTVTLEQWALIKHCLWTTKKWWRLVKVLIHYTFYMKICIFRSIKNMFLINIFLTEYSNTKFLLNKPYKNVSFQTIFPKKLLIFFKSNFLIVWLFRVQINHETWYPAISTQFRFFWSFWSFLKWAKIGNLLSK